MVLTVEDDKVEVVIADLINLQPFMYVVSAQNVETNIVQAMT